MRVWLALTDLGVIVWATLGAQVLRFRDLGGENVASTTERLSLDYSTFSIGLAIVWWLALRAHGLDEPHVLGHGATEYRSLGAATLGVFAGLALIGFALQVQVARGYILLALPAGLFGLFVARQMWRRWIGGQRVAGRLSHDVLVVGEASHVEGIIEAFRTVPEAGYHVVAVCTSTTEETRVWGVPVVGTEQEAARVATDIGVDVVACGALHRLGISGLRRLGWALKCSGIALVVSPGLTEIAGPRVLSRRWRGYLSCTSRPRSSPGRSSSANPPSTGWALSSS